MKSKFGRACDAQVGLEIRITVTLQSSCNICGMVVCYDKLERIHSIRSISGAQPTNHVSTAKRPSEASPWADPKAYMI